MAAFAAIKQTPPTATVAMFPRTVRTRARRASKNLEGPTHPSRLLRRFALRADRLAGRIEARLRDLFFFLDDDAWGDHQH